MAPCVKCFEKTRAIWNPCISPQALDQHHRKSSDLLPRSICANCNFCDNNTSNPAVSVVEMVVGTGCHCLSAHGIGEGNHNAEWFPHKSWEFIIEYDHNFSYRKLHELAPRNAIPVRVKATVREGHGKLLQQNINVPSTTVQKFSHEISMSHIWPPETMMSGKFSAQKNLVHHPSVLLGDQFAREVLHNNSSATFGRDAIHS